MGPVWVGQTSNTSSDLWGVWGSGSSVWIVGGKADPKERTLLLTTNGGTTWGATTYPAGGPLHAVWGSDLAHIYAVGQGGTALFSTNGTTWDKLSGLSTNQDLYGVWGFSANDIYVVGSGGLVLRSGENGQWSVRSPSGLKGDFRCVWGLSANNV